MLARPIEHGGAGSAAIKSCGALKTDSSCTGQWCSKNVAVALMSFHTATECKVRQAFHLET